MAAIAAGDTAKVAFTREDSQPRISDHRIIAEKRIKGGDDIGGECSSALSSLVAVPQTTGKQTPFHAYNEDSGTVKPGYSMPFLTGMLLHVHAF